MIDFGIMIDDSNMDSYKGHNICLMYQIETKLSMLVK